MSLRVWIAVVSACLLGCSGTQGAQTPGSPSGSPKADRFAVLPINALVPIAPELSGATDRVLGPITRYLDVQGRERWAVEPSETRQLWLESTAEVVELGEQPKEFASAIRVFARKLGEARTFDALVVASIVYREARLRRRLVKWDGVVRRIGDAGEESNRVPESYEGSVSGVSLHVMVFDVGGELIFENYGGLDLAHELSVEPGEEGALGVKVRDRVLGDYRVLREGVELAFEPYFPRPRSADW
jgi:hypothetical protein